MYMGFPGGSDGKEFTCNAGDLEKGMANQSILKEISPGFHWKDWCWSWNCNTLATSFEELTHWKRPWCWEGLGAGEGDDRGWDGWMASLIQWAWVWVNSRSWWWTGSWRAAIHGVIKSRTRLSDWTELNWTTLVFLPGESHGQRSLVGYSPWGHRVRHDRLTFSHTRICFRYTHIHIYQGTERLTSEW